MEPVLVRWRIVQLEVADQGAGVRWVVVVAAWGRAAVEVGMAVARF